MRRDSEAESSLKASPAGKCTRGVLTVKVVFKKNREFVLFTFFPSRSCLEMIQRCFRNCF